MLTLHPGQRRTNRLFVLIPPWRGGAWLPAAERGLGDLGEAAADRSVPLLSLGVPVDLRVILGLARVIARGVPDEQHFSRGRLAPEPQLPLHRELFLFRVHLPGAGGECVFPLLRHAGDFVAHAVRATHPLHAELTGERRLHTRGHDRRHRTEVPADTHGIQRPPFPI